MKKKILSLALALVLVLALILPAQADGRVDGMGMTIADGYYIRNDGSLWSVWEATLWESEQLERYGHYNHPINDVMALSANGFAVIKTDGSLWMLGGMDIFFRSRRYDDTYEYVMSDVAAVSWGSDHIMVLKTDGSLWGWGVNYHGAVGDGTASVFDPDTMGPAVNNDNSRRTPVKIMDSVAAVTAGHHVTMAIKTDGSLWAWGWNFHGQLGDGTRTDRHSPVKIMSSVSAVSMYQNGTRAIKTDGSLWAWGDNSNARLGDGTDIRRLSPVKIMDSVASFVGGMVIKTDGSLLILRWDPASGGKYTDWVKVMDSVVSAAWSGGYGFRMVLKKDGSLWAVDSDGQEPVYITENVLLPGQTPITDPLDTASDWARPNITAAIEKGFVPKDIQNNYQNDITRQEFCRMAVMWLEYKLGKSIDAIVAEKGIPERMAHTFSDTSDPNILAAYRLGVTSGTAAPTADKPGQFTPNGTFDRQSAATMLRSACKVAGFEVDGWPDAGFADMGKVAGWAQPGVNFCRANGIMSGDGTNFNPGELYSRQHSIITFNNIK